MEHIDSFNESFTFTNNHDDKVAIKSIIIFLNLQITENNFAKWLIDNNINPNPDVKFENIRGVNKNYLHGYIQNEDNFPDSMSDTKSFNTFKGATSPSRNGSKFNVKSPPRLNHNNSNSIEDKLNQIILIHENSQKILKNIKHNENEIENMLNSPNIFIELLRGKYPGMDFKIVCKKFNTRSFKTKTISNGIVSDI